ncbi:hypothetical protein BBJ28_00015454 [Nothophytophthora sp. Chile5]|nr:hypothetical protein BBJ28_00015454 [Nothophytophthora sp. Chile5]
MGKDDDEGVAFQAGAFDVVGSWLLGGDAADDGDSERVQEARVTRRPVSLYRPSASSKPSLTGRPVIGGNSNPDAGLTEQQREMKRKLLRKPRRGVVEEAAAAVAAQTAEANEALDKEEEELVRYKKETLSAAHSEEQGSKAAVGKKRKANAQDELLEKLREEAARKKAKNLKAKLRLQRKKHEQRKLRGNTTATMPAT